MQFKKSALKFPAGNRAVLLILCLAAFFGLCGAVEAQSGRRTNKGIALPKSLPAPIVPPDAPADNPPAAPKTKISSLIMLGATKKNAVFAYTGYLDVVFKESLQTMEYYVQKTGANLTATKGGKADLQEAIERAKKETGTHILWYELSTRFDGNANEYIEYLDYTLIQPQTGQRLASGRVQPGRLNPANGQGGILRLPTSTSRRRMVSTLDLRASARQAINELIRWEWL